MSAIFIAAAFAAAYIYLIKSVDASYRILRMDGYRLYFYVGSYAAGFAVLSAVTTFLLDIGDIPSRFLPELFGKNGGLSQVRGLKSEELKISAITGLTFAWALLLLCINRIRYCTDESKLKLIFRLTKSNAFERLLLECSLNYSPVAVTLDTEKVYVGLVHELDLESGGIEYVTVIPFLSGYRTSKEKNLTFTTNYYQHYEKMEDEMRSNPDLVEDLMNSFRVTIPFGQIVSLSRFDIDAYKAISNQAAIIPEAP